VVSSEEGCVWEWELTGVGTRHLSKFWDRIGAVGDETGLSLEQVLGPDA
jgi:hypothetical protein